MTQQELNHMIDAGYQVDVTAELMSAVSERAHRERSKFIRSGLRQLRSKFAEAVTRATHRKPALLINRRPATAMSD